MSMTTSSDVADTSAVRSATRPGRLTFGHALHSEWIKLTTLKSTWITLAALLVLMSGVGLVGVTQGTLGDSTTATNNFFELAKAGEIFGVFICSCLGAVVGAREFSSGMIHNTLVAVPRRGMVTLAKTLAFTATILPVVVVGLAIPLLGGLSLVNDASAIQLGQSAVIRSAIGTVAYLVGLGILGVAVGLLLRNTAGSIAVLLAGILVLPIVVGLVLPRSLASATNYLPTVAAQSFTSMTPPDGGFSPWLSAVVFAAWVFGSMIGAALLFQRRDA